MAKKVKKNRIVTWIHKAERFITHDLWSIHLEDLPPRLRWVFKYLRVFMLALKGFTEDRIMVKASALTYYTLMSIVPIFAMAFGIAKGFGLEKYLEEQIKTQFQGQEEVMTRVIDFANSLLARTGGGIIAGIGIVVLFWSVIKVLSSIEHAFNDIWQIEKPRTWLRKFTDYLTLMLIAPVLLISSSSMHIYLATQVTSFAQDYEMISYISPVIFKLLQLLPYVLIWILFSVIFIAIPNTKVSYPSGIIAGVISGSGFVIVQWLYITLQIGVSRYNAIYGSFAALPLFLIWLQTSWQIVLFGAEISFAYQNVDMYEFEKETTHISHRNWISLAVLVLSTIVKRFVQGEKPLTSLELSRGLKLPQRLTRNLLDTMVDCGLLNEVVTSESKNPAYQPARHIDQLTLAFVEDKLETHGFVIEPNTDEMAKVKKVYEGLAAKYSELTSEVLLKNL
ncbi:MAG: rane protein [Tenuifilum sp.]|jgi:membrane protein|uniref:YihY/virulence factor BrkB family protein n=1 Tax=Tenuifilum sp. TaxID=2760880 RepID=UPI0024AAF47E|nr:YihY/virulence factor BrkB family protein [Tenuifilum sp.]MDI3526176.1 rane protein [Tenuifilum sp.]